MADLDHLRSQLDDAEHHRDLLYAEFTDADNALLAAKRRREKAERDYIAACGEVTRIARRGHQEDQGAGA